MVDFERAEKLPPGKRYFNISTLWIFYFRYAVRLFYRLHIPHEVLTILSILFGLLAAYAFSRGANVAAALLIHLKDVFDACDGAVARLTGRGHLIGRYLDSLGDFFTITLVMIAIAVHATKQISAAYFYWGGAAILSTFLQCSFFNYYQLSYLEAFGIDSLSSRRDEKDRDDLENATRHGAEKFCLAILRFLYMIIYGWQDYLVSRFDDYLCRGNRDLPSRERFGRKSHMVLQSALCFGTHIFVIIVSALAGRPYYAIVFIATVMNLYLIFVLYSRSRHYRTHSAIVSAGESNR
jgi:phosphatidylserine synthase